MSPDTVSSLFPDRPIRPLPKRRLRERLSPEVADSIKYPLTLRQSPSPMLHYPPLNSDRSPPRFPSGNAAGHQRVEAARAYTPRRGGTEIRPGEEIEIPSRSSLVTRASPEILHRAPTQPVKADTPHRPVFGPPPPPSAASSVDGYESFENTSNKKKRKIPSAADSALNFSHGLVADVDASSLDSPGLSTDELNDDRLYHNTPGYYVSSTLGSSAQGMSGSGRGRLGRVRNGRSPLRALPDGSNVWPTRSPKSGMPLWASSADPEGGGIISSAIAKAEMFPPQGQENVSLLQQHSAPAKNMPGSTQFTFTCDSRVPGSLQWPGHSRHSRGLDYVPMHADDHVHVNHQQDSSSKSASRVSGTSRPRTRRQLDKELARAAQERRAEATAKYYNSPPKPDDIWVCEFCEYERIFGEPPRALIRAYEKKDRLVRQEAADRKRLLEKAKAKARKGKRNSKAAAKANTATNAPSGPAEQDAPLAEDLGDEERDGDAEYKEPAPNPRSGPRPAIHNRGSGSGSTGARRSTMGSSTGPPI